MRRRTFDSLMTAGGVVTTIVLLVAGALLFVGYNFADSNVRSQLSQQHITMPAGPAIADPAIKPYLTKYAGQPMTNGAQAEAYANHFIAVHLTKVAGGKTYSQVSGLALQNPTDTTLQGQVQTLFRGETLRGLLLNAYAFWKVGQIAFIAGIVAFAAAGVMALLTIMGFWHLRKVSPVEEFLAPSKEVSRVA
jgi:hypothetical protein